MVATKVEKSQSLLVRDSYFGLAQFNSNPNSNKTRAKRVEKKFMPVVLVTQDGKQQIKFDRPILLIGRHPECDIVLANSNKVSRKHCCLSMINDYFVIRDLGSTNGVRVNGKDVAREARINLGDVLQVGDVNFLLQAVNRKGQRIVPKAETPTPVSLKASQEETVPPKKVEDVDISRAYPVPIAEESHFEVINGEIEEISEIDIQDTPMRTSHQNNSKKRSNSDSHVEVVG